VCIKCQAKPQGGDIPKIRGLRQGFIPTLHFENVLDAWVSQIEKHDMKCIMNLNIHRIQGIRGFLHLLLKGGRELYAYK
jgi:hypothetical protein